MKKRNISILISILVCSMLLSGCAYISAGESDFSYKLSGNYILFHTAETNIRVNNGEETITPEVTGIAWNDDFILAEQKVQNTSNYWIIDVKNNKTYGPLDSKSFDAKKNELKVIAELKLEKPEKYKYLDTSSPNSK